MRVGYINYGEVCLIYISYAKMRVGCISYAEVRLIFI